MYKVLWFDDEHEQLETIKESAFLQDIELIGFTNAHEGLAALKNHPHTYDAILLDGLFFMNAQQTGIAVSGNAFGQVAKELTMLKSQGHIKPWFTFSGQPKFVKQDNDVWAIFKDTDFGPAKVYDKSSEADFENLCLAIKSACNNVPILKIKMEYSKSFLAFEKGIISQKYLPLLNDVLLCYNKEDFRKKNITVQRDLLEAIWKSLNNPIPCMPGELYNERLDGKPIHEHCAKFWENRTVKDVQNIRHPPSTEIAAAFRFLKESTNKNSHLGDEVLLKNDFKINTYLLIKVLEWLPDYVEQHYSNYI